MRNLVRITLLILFVVLSFFTSNCKKDEPAKLATVVTTTVTNITTTTATGGGNISTNGGAEVLANGVCWSVNVNPSIADSKTVDGVGAAQFVSSLNSLTAGTAYHVRAYATNSVGTAYGADLSFTTLGQAPSGVTQSATNILATGATLNGTVNANNLSTIVTFEFGTSTSYGSTATPTQSPVSGNAITNVSADLSELSAGTTYHFRIKTVNTIGTSYGDDVTFTTLGQTPSGVTQAATNITATNATLNGNVNPNNLTATVTFEYGTSTSYGSTATALQSPVSGNAVTNVSADISGLTGGTIYHFRLKTINSLGTVYGADMVFTTLQLQLTDGLVAYYPFNGNANDGSGNGNNGTNNGATLTTDRFGIADRAYNFDGLGNFIEILHSPSLNFGTLPITISVWININDAKSSVFISKERTTAPDGSQLRMETAINPMRVGYSEGVNNDGLTREPYTTQPLLSSTWYNIVIVKNDISYKLYLNGQQNDNLDIVKALDQSNNLNNITLGAESQVTGPGKLHFYSGKIDDVRFYTRALNDVEIGLLYNEGGYTGPDVVTDIDGNSYNTVKIGNQIWMSENLKVTKYPDGTPIADGTNVANISSTDKYYFIYQNDPDYTGTYGLLYSWSAATNGISSATNPSGIQGVCPTGWHVPSNSEKTQLITFLGGTEVAGGKLKEAGTSHWQAPNTGATNESGFTALGSGSFYYQSAYRYVYGIIGTTSSFWTATTDPNHVDTTIAYALDLGYDYTNTAIDNADNKGIGESVRCVKDN